MPNSNFLVSFWLSGTVPSLLQSPEITASVNNYRHNTATPVAPRLPRCSACLRLTCFYFWDDAVGRLESSRNAFHWRLLLRRRYILSGHRTIMCLIKCETTRTQGGVSRGPEKIKGWCCKASLRLEGAVTWQPWDHVSRFACVRACVGLLLVCICVRVCRWSRLRFRTMFSVSTGEFHTPTVPHESDLRNDKWNQHHAQLACLMALHAPPSHLFNCTVLPQVGCLWFESLPSGWRACCWMTRARTSVESSYWMNPQMSCKMAPGLCSL